MDVAYFIKIKIKFNNISLNIYKSLSPSIHQSIYLSIYKYNYLSNYLSMFLQATEWYLQLLGLVPTDPTILQKVGNIFDSEGKIAKKI